MTELDEKDIKNLDTLNKVIEIIKLNSKSAPRKDKDGAYIPIYIRGEVVFCDFVGIGTEITEPHYAIVLHAPKGKEAITVVPMTSTCIDENEYQFCIGKIPGFITQANSTITRDTYVYCNKIKEVSRKRLEPWYKRDVHGNVMRDHKNNRKVHVVITSDQMKKIEDAIRVTCLDCPSLFHILTELINKGVQFPVKYDENILQYGFRAVDSYNIDDSIKGNYKLNFKMYNGISGQIEMKSLHIDTSIQELCNDSLVKYDEGYVSFRNNVIEGLFSNKTEKVNCAKLIIDRLISNNIPKMDSENIEKKP